MIISYLNNFFNHNGLKISGSSGTGSKRKLSERTKELIDDLSLDLDLDLDREYESYLILSLIGLFRICL